MISLLWLISVILKIFLTKMNRKTLPADLKRRILVEAGHRCAIPTCRFPTTEVAHIIPYSKVKKHEYHNLIALCPNCHTRFDNGEIDEKSMRIYKNKLVFLSDRYSPYELNVLQYLRKQNKVIIYGSLSVKNIMDDNLVKNAHTITQFNYNDGTNELQEFVVVLTDIGQEFMRKWIDPLNTDLTYDN